MAEIHDELMRRILEEEAMRARAAPALFIDERAVDNIMWYYFMEHEDARRKPMQHFSRIVDLITRMLKGEDLSSEPGNVMKWSGTRALYGTGRDVDAETLRNEVDRIVSKNLNRVLKEAESTIMMGRAMAEAEREKTERARVAAEAEREEAARARREKILETTARMPDIRRAQRLRAVAEASISTAGTSRHLSAEEQKSIERRKKEFKEAMDKMTRIAKMARKRRKR